MIPADPSLVRLGKSLSQGVRSPVGLDPQVGQQDLGTVVARHPRDVSTRVTTGSTEVHTRQVTTIMTRPWKRTMESHLPAGQGPNQQVPKPHVGQLPRRVQWATGSDIQ